jgi:hypothetical protein
MNDQAAVAQTSFIETLATAVDAQEAYAALYRLADELVGVRLFTIMCIDMNTMMASRAFTSDAVSYPVSGTKPVEMNAWFDVVHTQRRTFVASTLAEIAQVFPDHALIGSLGCGSVVNLPVVIGGALVASVNLLHQAHYYTQERVSIIEQGLILPAMAAWLVHQAAHKAVHQTA